MILRYILGDRLIFIEETSFAADLIQALRSRIGENAYTMERFLDDFFMAVIEEDILYLAVLEREIASMEETVLEGETAYFIVCSPSKKKFPVFTAITGK